MTLTEQILARASRRRQVGPGDEVWARVDLAVMHDSSGPRRLGPILDELGGRVWDPDRVVLAVDHFTPAATVRHAEILAETRAWARRYDLRHFFDSEGILHTLLVEHGLVLPGTVVAGADSHTLTAGVCGAMAVGVGSTEMAAILATGEMWVSVPPSVLVEISGTLPRWVSARDITMLILKELRADFALGRAIEFRGDTLAALPLDERSVLTNQAIEMGAHNALLPPDEVLRDHLQALGRAASSWEPAPTEEGEYAELYRFAADGLEPLVACPPAVDAVRPARDLAGVPLDRAYLGSCAGGTYSDLAMAARVLAGRKARIPLTVVPATRAAYLRALADGTLAALVRAGATVHAPGCGACAGLHSGLLASGERCIATVTRNYPGRMGAPTAEIYLASPYTVAASAVRGHIADPSEVAAP
jgi:3-isopropylmalate/(R)-2-methylmalate dehydratase large subunit